MNPNFILFTIIPFVLMLAISIGLPFYRIKVMNNSGEKLIPLVKKSARLSYITSVVAVILALLSVLIDFGKFDFVIPYCAVLGLFVATRESTFLPVNGVYEKLLVVGSDLLKYEDIVSLPSEEEAPHLANVIVVITKSRGKRQFTFDNANEAQEVLKVLQSIDKAN